MQGEVTGAYRRFLGIPYAAAPVGALRWRAPRPADAWEGVRDATRPGPVCPQLSGSGVTGSEDCLSINVTTPRHTAGKLPVIVFVAGGGLINGSGAANDPRRIVDQEAVVVTFNYRLGALGFLRHPSLGDPNAGNFGLVDQQAALRWVRRNVAAFGGDNRNVTLWGQSAGGYSVCAQLAAPGARGLFDKAIVQSAPCGNSMMTERTADRRGIDLATEVGCSDGATVEQCLRAKPVGELVRPSDRDGLFSGELRRSRSEVWWFPVAGTAVLPLQPLTALRLGVAAPVPLVHGGTKDEMSIRIASTYDFQGRPLTEAEYRTTVATLFGEENAERILAVYPTTEYPSPTVALSTLYSDYGGATGTCTQLPAIDAAARRAPVYAYEYAQPLPDMGGFPVGAPHSADLPYFLDTIRGDQPQVPFTPEEEAFAERLIGYWTTFARTGNPGPQWPAYRRGTSTALSLAIARTGPVNLADTHHCGFWQTVN